METREYSGTVIKGLFAKNSKSEHEAVYLKTQNGRFVLRRQGGNPFYDPELEKLVGKTIRCKGVMTGYTLIISHWTVISDRRK